MRLSLKKRLKPFQSLNELADALDLTIPELKRKIRRLQDEGTLSLSSLVDGARPSFLEEHTFELFHQAGRCLVCGHEMRPPSSKRDIGWGEFQQCPNCEFSAHDLANYKTRKRAALAQLAEMISQSKKTEQVLRARSEHDEALRKG